MNSIQKKKDKCSFFDHIKSFINSNRNNKNQNDSSNKISKDSCFELINKFLSSIGFKHNINIYTGALISNKIGIINSDYKNQIDSLNEVLLTLSNQPKVLIPAKEKVSRSNGLNKSLESLSIRLKNFQYEDKSLAEFLKDEIQNINRSNTIITSYDSTEITKNKDNWRPLTPAKNDCHIRKAISNQFNTIEYNNNTSITNVSQKSISIKQKQIIKTKLDNNPNTFQSNQKISYCSFRNYISPKKLNRPSTLRKDIPCKNKNSSRVKIFNKDIYTPVNKSTIYNTIQSPKKQIKYSFSSKPMTSNTSRNASLMSTPKNHFRSNNTCEGLFNIKIDLRDLMKEDANEDNKVNSSFATDTKSIDKLIIDQKIDEYGNIVF